MNNPQEMWFPFQDAFKYFDTLKNYNPVTNLSRFFNNQLSITYNADDAAVVDKVGSYGSQLGKIIRLLDVLVAHANLPESELKLKPLTEFRQLSEQVKGAVVGIKGQKSVTQADAEQLIEKLQSLVDQFKTGITAEDKRKGGKKLSDPQEMERAAA